MLSDQISKNVFNHCLKENDEGETPSFDNFEAQLLLTWFVLEITTSSSSSSWTAFADPVFLSLRALFENKDSRERFTFGSNS